IGIDDQPRGFTDMVEHAVAFKLFADCRALAALPDDGVVDRSTAGLVPDDGGFALIGNTDGGHLIVADTSLSQRLDKHGALGRPDFHGIVLDPARLRIDLSEFTL